MIRPEGPNGHLTDDEMQAFLATLRTTHYMRVELRLKDQNEKTINSLTAAANNILSGAVQLDTTSSVSRSLQITLLDRNNKLRFEPGSPAHGTVYADRFLAVRYEVYVPSVVTTAEGDQIDGIGDWVSTPVFWGPLSSYKRTGSEVSIEALGKEALMLDPYIVLSPFTIHKGTTLHDAIKDVAGRFGESRFDLPDLSRKLGRDRNVHSQAEPWIILTNNKDAPGFFSQWTKKHRVPSDTGHAFQFIPEHGKVPGLIESIPGNYFGLFNGLGRLEVRKVMQHPCFRFTDVKNLTQRPEEDYDTSEFRNFWKVLGGKQKGHDQAEGHVSLPPGNPMSAQALARTNYKGDDIPRRMAQIIEADNLTSSKACRKRADDARKRAATEGIDLSFECFPVPMIEEKDMVTVSNDEWTIDFSITQATIPLTSDSNMTIGRHERVKLGHRRSHGGGRAGPPGGRGGHPGGHHHHHHHGHHHHHHHRGGG